jgi:hypothetical protein
MANVSPPVVVKTGELHRKHPIIKTWKKYFVVLDTYTCKYFDDATSFYSGHHAFGVISLKGAMVFNGGESGTMNAPRIHIVSDPNAAHDIFDHRLTCFSHPDREVVEDWMDALQDTIVKRDNMEQQHAPFTADNVHITERGVVGVGLSIDSAATEEGNSSNGAVRKSVDLNPLQKIAQTFSKLHERDTVIGNGDNFHSQLHSSYDDSNRTRGDSDVNSLEDNSDLTLKQLRSGMKLNAIESVTLEDPPLPSDDLEVLPHTMREDIIQSLNQFRKNFETKTSLTNVKSRSIKWEFVCRKDGVSVYKRYVTAAEENSKYKMKSSSTSGRKRTRRVLYKAACYIPSTPHSIAAVICDPQSRPAWDIDFPFSTIVDNIGPSTDVLHVQGGVVWNETQRAASRSIHDHRDIVTEASRVEKLNVFHKRGIGSFASCIICFICSYYTSKYWTKENYGILLGEQIPIEWFGIDANIFGAIIGAMFGGILVGTLANFFIVPFFSYFYCGLVFDPNTYFSKRDFCILRHVEVNSVGDIEIVERSVDNVRCPRTLVHVRGEIYGGGFRITPTSRNSWPGSKVEYIIDADFNGNLFTDKIRNFMILNRIKVLPTLRELIAHCMQQQRHVDRSTWKSQGGGMEKKYYILERPIGDCIHAERSHLITNIAFRRVWNDTSKRTCWMGSNMLTTIDENIDGDGMGYRFKTLWDKSNRNVVGSPSSKNDVGNLSSGKTFDWIEGLPDIDAREEDNWDPEKWMHGMTRLATGGLKGVTNKHEDNTRTLGTRRLFVDVISDVAQDVFHSQGTAHYSDKMATHMLAVEARNLLEACTDNFLYAPKFLDKAYHAKSDIERFKLVMAFAVAGLYKNARQTKPSVPDLGKTYAGKMQNGSMCIVEMIGKEPPQVGFKVLSPSTKHKDDDGHSAGMSSGNESEFSEDEAYENMNYSEDDGNTSDNSNNVGNVQTTNSSKNITRAKSPMFSDDDEEEWIKEGNGREFKRMYDSIKIRNRYGDVGSRWKVKGSWDLITLFKGNIIETSWHGPTTVVFNNGSRVRYTMPTVLMTGVMWGERVTEIIGEMIFSDHQNNLECRLRFNPYVKSGVESLFKKTVSDHVRGEVLYKNKVVSVAEGSWLDGLYFDGKPYWEMHRDRPANIMKCE